MLPGRLPPNLNKARWLISDDVQHIESDRIFFLFFGLFLYGGHSSDDRYAPHTPVLAVFSYSYNSLVLLALIAPIVSAG